MDEAYLHFNCSLGKSKKGGARRPFEWIVPRCLEPGVDTLGPLISLFNELAAKNPSANFLVPDIRLRLEGRIGVFDDTAELVMHRAMPYSKFVDLPQGLLLRIGLEREAALGVTFNTLRRTLPSVGEAVSFSTEEMQSLSNWTELVKGAGSDETKTLKASHPTSRDYAGGKWISAAINRHKAVILCHMAAAGLGLRGLDITCTSISWKVMRQLRGQIAKAEVFATQGPPWALPNPAAAEEPELDLSRMEEWSKGDFDVDGATADKSTSSSDSYSEDESASDEPEEEQDAQDAELPLPYRARAKGKIHLQHFVGTTGVAPYCRDTPFANILQEGSAVLGSQGQWTLICKTCRMRLPEGIARRLRFECGRQASE